MAGLFTKSRHDPDWAWAPYRPDARRPWDMRLAGHLYRRAAFGATWRELRQAVAAGPGPSIRRLLSPPADVAALNRRYDAFEEAAANDESADELRAWWLRRMIVTPHPLLERMTLFWHGHFAASAVAVQDARLLRQYVARLRTRALGRFDHMLDAATHDPAVIRSFAPTTGDKTQPNQRFAQAVLGAFSTGPFGKRDIREAARALTGWRVVRGKLQFVARRHDAGTKRIFGEEGNFKSRDVVRMVLKQPGTPRQIVGQLYRWLIAETDVPPPGLLKPLAESFAKDYNIARLVKTMLRSNLFFAPAAYRRRIKSPIEFAVGIIRALEGMPSTTQLGQDLAALGQDLCRPPTIAGWSGGRSWINSATLVGRSNMALALVGSTDRYVRRLDPSMVAAKYGFRKPVSAASLLVDLFLQGDLDQDVRDTSLGGQPVVAGKPSAWLRRVAHGIVTLPEFQLQ